MIWASWALNFYLFTDQVLKHVDEGLIMNRDNDERIGETIFKYTPFIPKIEVKDLARAIRINAEQV